jgi:uncharacterized protein YvpB
MIVLWKGIKVGFAFSLIVALLVTSTFLVYLLFGEINETRGGTISQDTNNVIAAEPVPTAIPKPTATPASFEKPASFLLKAPVINQYPELPAGCEITSLAMMLQYAGFTKTKLELYEEMPKDSTPIQWDNKGNIKYWGNPNTGYVGDATPRAKGFAIFHEGLFPLLESYIPTAIDLTRESFDKYEEQIAKGYPVLVWTTIDFKVPQKWVVWDSPQGLVKTTFKEHAVLLVGYDEEYVYVNDPATGQGARQLKKNEFIASWVALGKQGLSYTLEE